MKNSAEQIKERLLKEGKTVSTAESISTGYLQASLASVSGASLTFKGGITAYMPEIKTGRLNIDQDLADRTNCVSEDIAIELAKAALEMFDSDYALATCGYAESYEKRGIKAPHAYFAIAEKTPEGKIRICFRDRIELLGCSRIEAQKETARVVMSKFSALLAEEFR